MKILHILLFQIIIIFQSLKEIFSYNDSFPYNWSRFPETCYAEDFVLSENYRPKREILEIYPVKGCTSDDKNNQSQKFAIGDVIGITNITFEPRLDYFFNHDKYPPADRDPPTSMTFRIVFRGFRHIQMTKLFHYYIEFGRCEDYHPIPKISKRTGKPIEFIGKKAILSAKYKITKTQFVSSNEYDYSYSDTEIGELEGKEINITFDGYRLNTSFISTDLDETLFYYSSLDYYTILLKVYDLPRMKVQGMFQYALALRNITTFKSHRNITYTVDTRNVFFQNISMFYNQKVNVTDEGLEPTGEDSGFWVKTPCNQIQMATIMVDYHFFEIIRRMKSYGYEFSDRFQLRIHTPFYRKTPNSEYSLFRSQWNETYPEPRVFIHPIYKYKEYCDTYKNCTKFNYTEWSTDPKFTKYIIDIKNEIRSNQIWINYTELEKIYEADGFHRDKLVINVNNTMTPHITQITNGLWAELYDTVSQDWVMKTKTVMDEVHGYVDNYEPDPFRNFYLTCEIPDNITSEDIEFVIKKYGVLMSAHLWYRLDVFTKGITKLYPPRFNTVFKFPPDILVTNETFMYTYQYYVITNNQGLHWIRVLKDLRETGVGDGTITNNTFDIARNQINISELHHNYPNGDDTMHYTQAYQYLCYYYNTPNSTCFYIEVKRQFLYYFYDLTILYNTNDTDPVDITVYHIKYVPYHSKNQINRGLHRWNPHHAGWTLPKSVYYGEYLSYYSEPPYDNYYYKAKGSDNYYNLRGSTNVPQYRGPDCVFSFSGGSTMRNTSCEFFNGIIADKPFTNYARDIYEEHIAYRTLNDKSFSLNTSVLVESYDTYMYLHCSRPGHDTNLYLGVSYWFFRPINFLQDGEVACTDFFVMPRSCYQYLDEDDVHLKPVTNQHNKTREYFIKLDLPKELHVAQKAIGTVQKCRSPKTADISWNKGEWIDHYCYYPNTKVVYAFNSWSEIGVVGDSKIDITLWVDNLYFDNTNPKEEVTEFSGTLTHGFYDDPFAFIKFPRNGTYYNNQTDGIARLTRSNETNDALSIYNFSVIFKDIFILDNLFRFEFDQELKYLDFASVYCNGEQEDNKQYLKLVHYHQFNFGDRKFFEPEEYFLNLDVADNINQSFLIFVLYDKYFRKFHPVHWVVSLIEKGQTGQIDVLFSIVNPRRIKSFDLYYLLLNEFYGCAFQKTKFTLINTKPQNLLNMTVTPNTYFTSDRAIYKFEYLTYMRETLIGDVFEYKTSWKTKYNNNDEDPNDKGYYINKIVIDRNYSSFNGTNMTLYAKFILNPSTIETQYIKDIKMYDKEGYLLSVCGDVIPIKMKKVPGFKFYEVYTNKTNKDSRFDINFEAVPEILIGKNDKLKMKFSSAVSLKEYPECILESSLGLNILDPEFICEIDEENNEITLSNGFKDIGENQSIFENITSIAITEQRFIFKLKDVPIYSKNNDHERIYSIELKTKNEDGIITQKTLLPSSALFNCDYKCKTCQENNPAKCITCNENYPFYFPDEQNCRKFCPKEKYYQKKNDNDESECLLCESPCENCEGNATNCTLCAEGYFMLNNNSCIENCGEGFEKDFVLRKCYPKIEKNETFYVDRTVYVNVSVPSFYPVYIERNICMIDRL